MRPTGAAKASPVKLVCGRDGGATPPSLSVGAAVLTGVYAALRFT
jgi:hypothetical protein